MTFIIELLYINNKHTKDRGKNLVFCRGTLNYHLDILKHERMISVFVKNHRSYYFENSGRYTYSEMEIFVSLKGETSYTICEYLLNMPGASRDDIAERVNASSSTVSWHMKKLCDARVTIAEKYGRIVGYRLSPLTAEMISRLPQKSVPGQSGSLFSCQHSVCCYDSRTIGEYSK